VALEQLFPERRPVELREAYADLGLNELGPDFRPYVVANMIATVDGRATVKGRTADISSDADHELFLDLRTQVDAVMAGTATIAIEGYGPMIRSPERKEQRRALGLEPVPLAVTASRSMELPVHAPLFQDPDSRILVLTSSERPAPAAPAKVTVERLPGPELDLAEAMKRLRGSHGVRSILLEGGPTLLAAMVAAGVVDELFLTLAAKLVGPGGEVGLLEGTALTEPVALELQSLLRDDSYLYLRYSLEPPASASPRS
jgi:riboflavin-specific deaminase-like protein